jgi:multidrug resistance protein, MATE family
MSDDLNARDLAVLSQVESSFDFDAASMSDATTNESHSDVASVDGDLSAVKIGSSAAGDEGDTDDLFKDSDENTDANELTWKLIRNAAPVIAAFFLSTIGNFVLMIFAGHSPSKSPPLAVVFAGVALSNIYCNVTYRSIIIGMTGAVETLGSQDNGAGEYRQVGLTLQRSIFVCGCISISSCIFWWYSESIFLALGMDPEVSKVARTFIRIRMFEIPMGCFTESFEKYLMSIGVMTPPLWGNTALNIGCTCFSYLFLFVFGLSYEFLGVAWVMAQICDGVAMVWSARNHSNVKRTIVTKVDWNEMLKWDKLKEFVTLGIPGTLQLCSEWWGFEVLTVMAGWLGTYELSAQTIILQCAALFFMIPLGLGIATASIVGNALGGRRKEFSIRMSHISIRLLVVIELVMIGVIMLLGRSLGQIFTNHEDILNVTEEVIPYLGLFGLFDGIQGVCSGILRGTGNQMIGAITNLIAFYVIGLPCAYVFTFQYKIGVPGLILGISIGVFFQSFALLYLIYYRQDIIFVYRNQAAQKGLGDSNAIDSSTLQEYGILPLESTHGDYRGDVEGGMDMTFEDMEGDDSTYNPVLSNDTTTAIETEQKGQAEAVEMVETKKKSHNPFDEIVKSASKDTGED